MPGLGVRGTSSGLWFAPTKFSDTTSRSKSDIPDRKGKCRLDGGFRAFTLWTAPLGRKVSKVMAEAVSQSVLPPVASWKRTFLSNCPRFSIKAGAPRRFDRRGPTLSPKAVAAAGADGVFEPADGPATRGADEARNP